MSNSLTEEQIVFILRQGLIGCLNEEEKKQVMDFDFGEEFMESEDKGERRVYVEEA